MGKGVVFGCVGKEKKREEGKWVFLGFVPFRLMGFRKLKKLSWFSVITGKCLAWKITKKGLRLGANLSGVHG